MDYTSNYKLRLPSKEDIIDISVLDTNFYIIDENLARIDKKIEAVELSNTLEVVTATGGIEFYHGSLTQFDSILQKVTTTWGDAVFRNKYGTVSASAGSVISLSITIEVLDGVIYWDEYYNGENGGEIFIGATALSQTSGGNTKASFSYTNDEATETKKLELKDAILELARQIQALRKE